jgi:hypothetical protein
MTHCRRLRITPVETEQRDPDRPHFIGDEQAGSICEKPVAWVNVSASPTGAKDAHDSLRKVLGYAHSALVESVCASIPVTRSMGGGDGVVSDPTIRSQVIETLNLLVASCVSSRESH